MRIKYLNFIIIFLAIFIFNISFCHAEIYRAKIIGSGVNLRSGPGTNYSSLKSISKNSEYTMVNNTKYDDESTNDKNKCSEGWYKIYYEGSAVGYVCGGYIEINTLVINETPTNTCEQSMKDLGFPASYWPYLCELKETHPTWEFTPIQTGLDWSSAVNSESACGKSYIASSVETNIDKTCKNEYTKTWYPASSTAVAYYMDPRNWLTEKYIFQFEYLRYDNNLTDLYTNAATSVIDHTEFYKYHNDLGNNLGNIINESGKETNVSPIFIASRILQELGSSTSLYNLYSGVYNEVNGLYKGYYNFYNFGVTDACANTEGTSICGLRYAYEKNWSSLSSAITGGASQIASGYIAKGQYTTYLQRFNVAPTDSNKLYLHQYMTNVAAPSSESKTAYNSYKELNLLDSVFSFYIPVYNNMNESNFIDGSGAVESPDSSNNTDLDISTIVTSSGYSASGNYLTKVDIESTAKTFISSIESVAGSGNVKLFNSKDELVTDGLVGTGYKVKIKNNSEEKNFSIVINGDTSGDGKVNALDLLQVQKSILGTYTLNDVYKLAGDTSDDGNVNALDLLQIQKSILGTYEIEQ